MTAPAGSTRSEERVLPTPGAVALPRAVPTSGSRLVCRAPRPRAKAAFRTGQLGPPVGLRAGVLDTQGLQPSQGARPRLVPSAAVLLLSLPLASPTGLPAGTPGAAFVAGAGGGRGWAARCGTAATLLSAPTSECHKQGRGPSRVHQEVLGSRRQGQRGAHLRRHGKVSSEVPTGCSALPGCRWPWGHSLPVVILRGPAFCGVPASSESLPRGPWTSSSGSRRGERSGVRAAPRRAARSAPVQRGAHAPPDAGLGVRILRRNPSVQQPVPDGSGQGTGSDPGRSGWPAGSSEQREPPAFLAARGPQTPRPLACRGDAGHLVLSPGHPPASGPAGGTGPGSSGGWKSREGRQLSEGSAGTDREATMAPCAGVRPPRPRRSTPEPNTGRLGLTRLFPGVVPWEGARLPARAEPLGPPDDGRPRGGPEGCRWPCDSPGSWAGGLPAGRGRAVSRGAQGGSGPHAVADDILTPPGRPGALRPQNEG